MYNADQVIADGGDIAVSPDNIDVNEDYLMINEDGTAQSRVVMAAKERNGNIWRINAPAIFKGRFAHRTCLPFPASKPGNYVLTAAPLRRAEAVEAFRP